VHLLGLGQDEEAVFDALRVVLESPSRSPQPTSTDRQMHLQAVMGAQA
jgi:hypothetical protein